MFLAGVQVTRPYGEIVSVGMPWIPAQSRNDSQDTRDDSKTALGETIGELFHFAC